MISFLVGVLEEKNETSVVLDVGGVGYLLTISASTAQALPHLGERCKLLTIMSVREDGVSLFGFSSAEERDIFNQLTTVSGVGPKLAITILSGLKLSDLISAISREDVKLLSSIKGLGKKTAERVCLELKDKLSPLGFALSAQSDQPCDEEAVALASDTLISLGVPKNEAYMLAKSCAKGSNGEDLSAEEIIARALRGYK